ncbi:nas-14, partial [Symbiodinium sp. CCMP2456]
MRVAVLVLTLSLVGEALPATAAEADEAVDVDVSSLELLKRHQVDFWTPWESNTNATSAAALLLRSEASGCVDKNWQCYGWARLGYCSSNAGYMRRNCRHSCNLCG